MANACQVTMDTRRRPTQLKSKKPIKTYSALPNQLTFLNP